MANGWKLLTIITKRSILNVAAVLDPALLVQYVLFETPFIERDTHQLEIWQKVPFKI